MQSIVSHRSDIVGDRLEECCEKECNEHVRIGCLGWISMDDSLKIPCIRMYAIPLLRTWYMMFVGAKERIFLYTHNPYF